MSDPTPPPSTPPASLPPATPVAPPAKKNNLLVRGGLGCLGLIVLACIGIGAFTYYGTWQQQQNYSAGHAAYQKADCAAAVGPLGKAASGDPGDANSDVALKAQAELDQCQALQAADELAATSLGDAVLAYRDFADKYPESPLKTVAIDKGATVFSSNPPEQVANVNLCNALDNLTEMQLITNADEQIPGLLIACGATFEAEQDYSSAVAAYNRFRQEYPDHAAAEQVEEAYVRATLAEADTLGAGALPSPQAVGASESAGTATVVIQNDSPESLSMVFSGPDTRVEDLDRCEECESFTDSEPDACPEVGPVAQYELAPGTYEVVVKASSDGSVTPFRGTWTLEAGQEYSSCFYLVRTSQ